MVLCLGVLAFPSACMSPRWPVEAELVSPFGLRFRGLVPELHRGVDLAAPPGTEVRAMTRGTVRFAGTMRGYGEVIWLDHPGNILTVYAHLSTLLVRPGEEVRGGQVIGRSGSSGDVTGPHLHFELWRHGREVDPVPLLGGFPGAYGRGRPPQGEPASEPFPSAIPDEYALPPGRSRPGITPRP